MTVGTGTEHPAASTSDQIGLRPWVPPQIIVHVALFAGQALNGGAGVVAKCGIPQINPVVFALLREACATPLLFCVARLVDGPITCTPQRTHLLLFAAFALFSNQIAYITGLKLSNPVVGAAWQPSQPIFVLSIAVVFRLEACTLWKLIGVMGAVAGCLFMTFGGPKDAGRGNYELLGNILFFYNCIFTALFVLSLRFIKDSMPSYLAMAVLYAMATLLITATAFVVGTSPNLQSFFCPECTGGFWHVPPDMVFPLAYWVLGPSVLSYTALTFGTKYAKNPSLCLAYSTAQPLVAGVLEALLVGLGWNEFHPDRALSMPGQLQLLGGCMIIIGLACVAADAQRPEGARLTAFRQQAESEQLNPT